MPFNTLGEGPDSTLGINAKRQSQQTDCKQLDDHGEGLLPIVFLKQYN